MPSKLDVDEIAAKNGTDPVTLTKQSAAKAFAHFDVDAVLDNSFNMSSATDNGVGIFTVTNTNAFADADFIVSGSVVGATLSNYACFITSNGSAKTSSTAPIKTYNYYDSLNVQDMHKMQVVEHGDLA